MDDPGPIIVELSPIDTLLDGVDDSPLTEADLVSIRQLGLTSCDFVGDSGCVDPNCWQCHSPIGPQNLHCLTKNLATAAILCRAWQLHDADPAWRPGCNRAGTPVAKLLTE